MASHVLRRFVIPLGLVVALAAGLFWFGKSTIADTLFSDSFGSTSSDNVPGWVENETSVQKARISTTTPRPGSPTTGHAVVRQQASITKQINAAGFKDIQLSYYWLGDLDAGQSDTLEVRWRVLNQATTTLASHMLAPPIMWSAQQTAAMGPSADNTTLEINFLGNTNDADIEAHLDDVELIGSPFGSITIEKITVPAGHAQLFDFALSGPDPRNTQVSDAGGPVTLDQVTTGTYTLTETVPTGWDFTSLECTGAAGGFVQNGASVTFTLAQGEQVSCSFSNTKRGSITVQKEVLSPNGFNPVDNRTFTAFLDSGSPQTFAEASSTVYANLLPGTYTITESFSASQFTFTSFSEDDNSNPVDGAQITLDPGEDAVLLITNTQRPGTFTVRKNIFAPDGTTDVPDAHAFTITLTGEQGHVMSTTTAEGADAVFSVDPNVTYTISESDDPDYVFLGCFLENNPLCTGNVPSNSSTTRIVRNAQKNGSITVQKDVRNPDGDDVSDTQTFTVNLDGQNEQTIAEGTPFPYTNLAPGTYTINEVNLPAGYTFDSFSIDEDGGTPGAQISIGSNDAVTLTITNRQQRGTIRVIKDVIGFDGFDIIDPHIFTATVTGQPNQPFSEEDPAEFMVNPGVYTVGELDDPNYDLVSIDPAAEVTITPGGSAPVTITNKPSAGKIDVKKVIQNPDGQPDLSDDTVFTATVPTQPNQPFSQTQDAMFTVGPGQYCVGEIDFPGYDLVSVTPLCVFVSSGATSTVTITNRQRPATIIVEKDVLNPDGDPVDDDTEFTVTTSDGQSGIVTELLPLTLTGVTPRVPVTVSEGDVPGYDMDVPQTVTLNPGATTTVPVQFVNRQRKAKVMIAKDVRNPNGDQIEDDHVFEVTVGSQTQTFAENATTTFIVNPGTFPIVETFDPDYTPDPNNQDEVTIGSGATTTITLVNFQKRGKIIITKDVVNPDLGPASDDAEFTVLIDGSDPRTLSENQDVTYDNLLPGTYTISETSTSTYDVVGFAPSATVTVSSNTTTTVTITNRQHPATIIVHKNVVGPDGETEVEDPHAFTAVVDTAPAPQTIAEGAPATFTVYPGDRTITELPDANYILHAITPSSTITIAPDQTINVTITNKPKLAMIKVNKFVQNVFGATTTDTHVFTVNAGNNSLPLVAGTQTVFTLLPGFYIVSETQDLGYDIISGSPTGVSLSAGQSTTVNIVNRQRRGKIEVIKNVIGPNGEEVNDSAEFQIQFNGGASQPIAEGATTTFDNLIPGTYTLTETQGIGYDAGVFSTTTPIVLDPGETVELTITNRQQPGSVSGTKFEDFNGNGIKDDGEPGIPDIMVALGSVSGPETPEGHIPIEIVALSLTSVNGAFTIPDVAPGQYKLFEEQRDGWVPTVPWHVDSFFDITYRIDLLPQQKPLIPDSFFDVFVGPGQSVGTGIPSGCEQNPLVGVCEPVPLEFGNFELGEIHGMKWNDLNGDGVKDEGEPGLEGWTITLNPGNVSTTTDANGNYSFENLSAGTYTVAEVQHPDWDQTFPQNPSTHTIQINSGDNEGGRDFGNRLRRGRIIVEKQTLPDGDSQTFEFIGAIDAALTDGQATSTDVEPGQYQVTETNPDSEKWMIEFIICDDENSVGDTQTGEITFNIEPGETVKCIVTNKKAALITVSKTSIGDVGPFPFSGTLGAFTVTTTQDSVPSTTSFWVFVDKDSEDITVSENVPTGWDVDQQTCSLTGVMPGDTHHRCEFINTKLGKIIVEKVTIGGDDDFDFTTDYGDPFTLSNGESNDSGYLTVPSTYSVSESAPPGWDLTSATCDNGDDPSAIELGPGEEVRCTFTNTKRGKLTIIKNTVGGYSTFDFDGPTEGESFSLTTHDPSDFIIQIFPPPWMAIFELPAGTGYSVTENVPDGWDLTQDPLQCQGVMEAGGDVTCTFTNTKRGTLTIVKETVGGDATFTFDHPTSTATFELTTVNGRATTTFELPAGTAYDVDEQTPPPGWELTVNPACAETMSAGGSVECRYVNVKKPLLTVHKEILNHGGAKTEADFAPYKVGDTEVALDTPAEFDPGDYTVSETVDQNYTVTFSGDCDENGNVTLNPGDEKSCTITNEEKTGTIEVIKKIVPAPQPESIIDDGDAGYSDTGWSFANDQGNAGDVRFIAAGDGTETATWTPNIPTAGSYQVYVSWTTHPNRATNAPYTVNHAGGSSSFPVNQELLADQSTTGAAGQWSGWHSLGTFTLNAGSNVVLNNNANEYVIADAVRFAPINDSGLFNLQIDGVTEAPDSGHNGTTGPKTVSVNTHTVGETAGTGTTLSDYQTAIECKNAQDQVVASGTGAGPLDVVVGHEDEIVCTITNTRNGKLTVIKNTVGGDATFTFTHPTSTDTFQLTSSGGTTQITFDLPGETNYNVTEQALAGWDLTNTPNCQGMLAPGEQRTCTFENTKKGRLTVVKEAYGGDDIFTFTKPTTTEDTFTLRTENGRATTTFDLSAGTPYSVTEQTPPPGWQQVGDPQCQGEIQPGRDVECRFVNKKAARITIEKTSVGGFGQFLFCGVNENGIGPDNCFVLPSPLEPFVQASSFFDVFVEIEGTDITVTETVPFGWDVDHDTCTLLGVKPGEERTCRFTNTKKSTLTIVKEAYGGDDIFTFTKPTTTLDTFVLATQNGRATTTFELSAGTQYSVTEPTLPDGWQQVGDPQCTGTIEPGRDVECRFVNKKAARITTEKTSVGGFGQFLFSSESHPGGGFGLTTDPEHNPVSSFFDVFVEIEGTDITVTETVPFGWDVDHDTCTLHGVKPGEERTCRFTNTKKSTLTIVKETFGGDDTFRFTHPTSTETFTLETQNGRATTTFDLSAETQYSVTEQTPPDGWQQVGDPQCTGTIEPGRDVECRFVNKKAARITTEKTSVGGFGQFLFSSESHPGGGFGLTTDPEHNPVSSFFDVFVEIEGTDITVTETVPFGWDVDHDTCLLSRVMPGATPTCSFTNTKKSTLTIVKEAYGGDDIFTFTKPTTTEDTFTLRTENGRATTTFDLSAGTPYSVTEQTPPDGWQQVGDPQCQGEIQPGRDVECRFVNIKQPKITVTKVVVNDSGGTKQVVDFPLFLDGNPIISSTTVEVLPGVHTVSEADTSGYRRSFSGQCTPEGWDLSGAWALDFILNSDSSHRYHTMNVTSFNSGSGVFSGTGSTTGTVPPPAPVLYTWTMTGMETGNSFTLTTSYNEIPGYTVTLTGTLDGSGQMSGTWVDNASNTGTFTGTGAPEPLAGKVTVGLGESAVCTITNDDEEATITVEKIVITDNGGTASTSDFALFVGTEQVGNGDPLAVTPGDYAVSETGPDGYTPVFSGDCDAHGNVTVALGEHKSCTITNDDLPTTLTVEKIVINDNDGTATTTDFILKIDGNQVTSGVPNAVSAGLHTVSEDAVSGYTGTIGGDCALDGTITLEQGDQKTCIITNNDQAATITVIKQVINNDGGTKQVADFPLFIDGNPTTSSTTVEVTPGAHVVSETNQTGYTPTIGGDCDTSGNVTLALGEHKICTIVNDDFQATLKMVKVVVNDDFGTAMPSQFSFLVGTTTVAHNQTVSLNAGTYAITELGPAGYTLASYSSECNGGSITLTVGSTSTCTIINDDVEVFGSVAGFKWLDRDEDGVKDLTEPFLPGWTITLSPDGRSTTTDQNGAYYFDNVTPGTHTVAEVLQAGWVQTYPVPPGTHTVTITGAGENFTGKNFGNILPPSVSGVKFEDTNGNGVREQGEPTLPGWTIRLKNLSTNAIVTTTTDANGAYAFINLDPGVSYRVSEVVKAGWVQTMPALLGTYTVTLQNGDVAVGRDFGNFRLAEIRGVKFEDVNGNGQRDGNEPLLPGWTVFLDINGNGTLNGGEPSVVTGAGGAYLFPNLGPGTYILRETMLSGWGQSLPGPLNGSSYSVTPESGDTLTGADFGNYRFAEIHGRKYQDNNKNGTRNAGENFLSGWTIELTHLNSGQIRRDVTDSLGRYDFTGLAPGNYQVREILKSGWVPINPRSTIYRVTLLSGQVLTGPTGLNFGNVTVAQFAGAQLPFVTNQSEGEPVPLTTPEQAQPPQNTVQENTVPAPEITQNQTEPQPPAESGPSAPSPTTPPLPSGSFLLGPGQLNTNLGNRLENLRSRLGQ